MDLVSAAQSAPQPTVPWWGLLLSSAVVGGLISQGLIIFHDWRKSLRDKTAAGHALRQETLLELLSAGSAATSTVDNRAEIQEFTRHFFRMLLLSGAELESKVRAYSEATIALAGHHEVELTPERKRLSDEYITRERQLMNYARGASKEFGLPGNDIAPGAKAKALNP